MLKRGSVYMMSMMTFTGLRTLALLPARIRSGAYSGSTPGPTSLRSLLLIPPLSARCNCTSSSCLGGFLVLDGGQQLVASLHFVVLRCCLNQYVCFCVRQFVIDGYLVFALSPNLWLTLLMLQWVCWLWAIQVLLSFSQWRLCLNSAWVWCASC